MRTLTLGFLNCPEVPPHELVTLAADAGFESVGIRITGRRVGDPYTPVIGNPSAIADIKARLRDTGVGLSNVSAYHLYPDVSLRALQQRSNQGCDVAPTGLGRAAYLRQFRRHGFQQAVRALAQRGPGRS